MTQYSLDLPTLLAFWSICSCKHNYNSGKHSLTKSITQQFRNLELGSEIFLHGWHFPPPPPPSQRADLHRQCVTRLEYIVYLNSWSLLGKQFVLTVLSRASAHPPILTVMWFFKVLRVTAHHAKFSHSESEGRSAERHNIRQVCTYLSVASFAVFFPCSMKFAYCKRRLNAAET